MPNIPSSDGQTASKKRKLSAVSRSTSTQNDSISTSSTASTLTSTSSQCDKFMSSEIDDAILNSEVYKIYCQNENTENAIDQIEKLKNCISIDRSGYSTSDDFKQSCDAVLNTLWSLGSSKSDAIQKLMTGKISNDAIFQRIDNVVHRNFIEIKMIQPYGYEYFFVDKFRAGYGVSKWYRGVSTEPEAWVNPNSNFWCRGEIIAKLNIIGISNSMINRLHYEHYLQKNSKKIFWFDFAADFVHYKFPSRHFPDTEATYDVEQVETNSTIEVKVTLQFTHYDYPAESYHGKSTRSLKKTKTRRPKNQKEIMETEAKKAALIEFFKDRFGFTEFNDIYIDEMQRPLADTFKWFRNKN